MSYTIYGEYYSKIIEHNTNIKQRNQHGLETTNPTSNTNPKSTTNPTSTTQCIDLFPRLCSQHNQYCIQYPKIMQSICAKTCNLCS